MEETGESSCVNKARLFYLLFAYGSGKSSENPGFIVDQISMEAERSFREEIYCKPFNKSRNFSQSRKNDKNFQYIAEIFAAFC